MYDRAASLKNIRGHVMLSNQLGSCMSVVDFITLSVVGENFRPLSFDGKS